MIKNFDWESFETHVTNLKQNKNIKTKFGHKVYSKMPYAQELYDLMTKNETDLKEPKSGEIMQSCVVGIQGDIAILDVNARQELTLDMRREGLSLNLGDILDVMVEKPKSKNDGIFNASFRKSNNHKIFDELKSSIGKSIAYKGKVKELIHGGWFVDIEGVTCFMPGSLGGLNKLWDFSALIGKELYFCVVNYVREKDYLVVSHRDYLHSLIPDALNNLKIGQKITGFVTGTTLKHGVFIEFNECLTGVIQPNDLGEWKEKYENGLIHNGEVLELWVKEINPKRILLSTKQIEETSRWDKIAKKYETGLVIRGPIKNITSYGVFIELERGINGMLHKSQMDKDTIYEIDLEVEVKIGNIDVENRKIDFVSVK